SCSGRIPRAQLCLHHLYALAKRRRNSDPTLHRSVSLVRRLRGSGWSVSALSPLNRPSLPREFLQLQFGMGTTDRSEYWRRMEGVGNIYRTVCGGCLFCHVDDPAPVLDAER